MQMRVGCVFGLAAVCCLAAVDAAAQSSRTPQQEARLRQASQQTDEVFKLINAGKHKDALSLAERALATRLEILGAKHAHTATAQNNLGAVYHGLGEYQKALKYFEQAFASWRSALGDRHADVATAANNVGFLAYQLGDYARARRYLDFAVTASTAASGARHANTAVALNNLGMLLQAQSDYKGAERAMLEALAIRREKLGERDPLTAMTYNNLGTLYQDVGNFAAARSNFEKSLTIRRAVRGDGHLETATSLHNLGSLLANQGDPQTGRKHLEEALAIRKRLLPPTHADLAVTHNNLATLLTSQNELKLARQHLQQAHEIWKRSLGEGHPTAVSALFNISGIYLEEGNIAEARRLTELTVSMRERALGPKHPDLAHSLKQLGALQWNAQQPLDARRSYQRAIDIWRTASGSSYPQIGWSLIRLAEVDAHDQDYAAAAQHADQARRVMRRHIARSLPGMSEREQLMFLEHADAGCLRLALSLGYLCRDQAAICAQSAAWLLNGKGLTVEALAERGQLARDRGNPQVAAVAQDLAAVRKQLADLSLDVPAPGREQEHRARLDRLEEREAELSRQLATLTGGFGRKDPWIELDEVRRQIPPGGVLIDFARVDLLQFGRIEPGSRSLPARYLAWIVPPAGDAEVQLIELGEAAAIDKQVETLRRALQQGEKIGAADGPDEAGAEEQLTEMAAKLAEQVLSPVLEKIGDARELLICPDGALWLVPFAALPLADGRYAVEEYQVQYLVSGRDLVSRQAASGDVKKPVVMADPNYDLSPADAQAAVRAVLGNSAGGTAKSGVRGGGSLLGRAERLPGTAAEAKAITPSLASYAGGEPLLYVGQYALEGVFKAMVRPRVVVLSTHGFFLPDQASSSDANTSLGADYGGEGLRQRAYENPLLRCGLLLAGCNQRSAVDGALDDGVLTGMEIVGVDLRGAELVVLSACETGVGQVRSGEGVAGLRQAFQLAGAPAVVATLWQIPDAPSAQLMAEYFRQLASGRGKAQALRDAQLAMIQARRAQAGAAHPFFWAAYTLTGR